MNPKLVNDNCNAAAASAAARASRPLADRLARWAAGALLALVVCAPALLAGGSSNGLGNSGNGTVAAGDTGTAGGTAAGGGDETVGTLPMVGVRLDFVRHARLDGPCLAIEGRFQDIVSAILSVRGSTTVRLDALPDGRVRAVFVGDVRVAFSALPFVRAGLVAGMLRPDGVFEALPAGAVLHDGARARVSAGGRTVGALRNAEIFLLQRR